MFRIMRSELRSWFLPLLFSSLVVLHDIRSAHGLTELKVGGIFRNSTAGSVRMRAFLFAIDMINNDSSILPNHKLVPVTNVTEPLSPYPQIQAACTIAKEGVVAIVGPGTSTDTKAASTVLSSLHLPEISPSATDPNLDYNSGQYPYLLRMSQPDNMQSLALIGLMERYHWKRMAILTSKTDYGANGLARFKAIAAEKGWLVVAVEEFNVHEHAHMIDAREQLTRIRSKGVRIVVLNCIGVFATPVLEQAHSLSMTGHSWAWIVTDGITSDNAYSTNPPSYLIGLLGTAPSSGMGSLSALYQRKWTEHGLPGECTGYDARAVDSVILTAQALHKMLVVDGKSISPRPLDCALCGTKNNDVWANGDTLLNYMRNIQTDGVVNFLNFTDSGSPWFSAYDIVNLQAGGFKRVLQWTEKDGVTGIPGANASIVWMGDNKETPLDSQFDLSNVTFRIVTISEVPFVIMKPGMNDTDINAYEGLCIDLLNKIQETLKFKYTIHKSKDGKYGSHDPLTNRWNGMIGELERGEVDIAVAAMTISFARQQVIQFTKPYLDLGLSILMKIPTSEVNMFGFKEPFSTDLWMCVVGSFVVVGFCTLLLDKLSPTGMYGSWAQDPRRDECDSEGEDDDKPSEYMDLKASMFFSFGALLQQGSDLIPRSQSGRVLAAFWWATIMIIISTYTANLAAFLTKNRMQMKIKDIEDLSEQTKVKYGTVEDTAVSSFFTESIVPTYNSMAQFMDTHGTLARNTEEAMWKVRNEDYAFIWDSPIVEYMTNQEPCDVMSVGRVFGKSGYGIALPKDSLYADRFSVEILRLRELGYIEELWNKWFTERSRCNKDSEETSEDSTLSGRLDVMDMLGVFIVLYAGIVLGILTVFVEWFVASWLEASKKHPDRPDTWKVAWAARWKKIKEDLNETWFAPFQRRRKVSDGVQRFTVDTVDGVDASTLEMESKFAAPPAVEEYRNKSYVDDDPKTNSSNNSDTETNPSPFAVHI